MTGRIERRLRELNIVLPTPAPPVGSYVPFMILHDLVTVSGQLPLIDGKVPDIWTGKVAGRVNTMEAPRAARQCFINLLAQVKAAIKDLDKVVQVVRLAGYVAAGPDFIEHHKVMNGASDLAVEVFGEAGRHTRTTIGASALPFDAAVEVEGTFRFH
jgi:enamine deaminase RidA (YjgF/YER057c/UK114 family)